MEFDTFKSSLAGASPPAGISGAVQALWWQAKGDWHKAHRCAQADANERWSYYEQLAGIHQSIPHIEAPELEATIAEIAAVRQSAGEDQA